MPSVPQVVRFPDEQRNFAFIELSDSFHFMYAILTQQALDHYTRYGVARTCTPRALPISNKQHTRAHSHTHARCSHYMQRTTQFLSRVHTQNVPILSLFSSFLPPQDDAVQLGQTAWFASRSASLPAGTKSSVYRDICGHRSVQFHWCR